jgi:predicted membrane protein
MHSHWQTRCANRTTATSRVISGLIVILAGFALLARQAGVELPHWMFTWPMFLIVLGLYIGARHNFSRGGWFVPILIGGFFLADDILMIHDLSNLIVPVLIIVAGIMIILRPRKHFTADTTFTEAPPSVDDELIDSTAVFGTVRKNVISKSFRGGEITCVFGGAEINLSQADITGNAVLDITCVMGGAKLIIPAHWEIRSEMTAVLGGIEDKRPPVTEAVGSSKVLILEGTVVMGGIDIRSY